MIIRDVFLDFACDMILFSEQPSLAATPVRCSKYLTGPFGITISICQYIAACLVWH